MMKNMKRIAFTTAIAFMVMFTSMTSTIHAAVYNGFSVTPILPENQIGSSAYFDLLVKPNDKQDISIRIQNTGSQTMIAHTSVNAAATGNNGVIVYNGIKENDPSMKVPITQLVSVKDQSVSIEAGASADVTLQVDMKDQTFEGDILGGIVVKGEAEKAETQSNGEPIGVENEVSYIIGLKLSMNETNGIDSNLSLSKVKADLVDYKASIVANIVNDQAVTMRGATIQGQIYKEGTTQLVSEVDLKDVKIAPNSNFNVVYPSASNKVEQGTYRIHMIATYQDKKWEWDETFVIEGEAQEINDNVLVAKTDYSLWIMVGVGILVAILLIIVLILVYKRKKDKE